MTAVDDASPPTTASPGPPSGGRRLVGPLALVAALLFLAGAVGYLIGARTSETPSSAIDVGFLQDMSDHHDQAVTIALLTLERSQDPVVRGFAQEVVLFQRSELGTMAAYLDDHGTVRVGYDPQRSTMGWMGMPTPLAVMPGMATEEQLEALREADGEELDRLFLELMTAHHQGGVHMASFAAAAADDERVRELADRMARFQTVEITEYREHLADLDAR